VLARLKFHFMLTIYNCISTHIIYNDQLW